MSRLGLGAVALALAAGSFGPVARGNPAGLGTEGGQLAAACASCHGADGHGVGIPSLSGLDAERIEQSMLAYRAASGGSQIMHVVARALSPREIAIVARYLAARPMGAARP